MKGGRRPGRAEVLRRTVFGPLGGRTVSVRLSPLEWLVFAQAKTEGFLRAKTTQLRLRQAWALWCEGAGRPFAVMTPGMASGGPWAELSVSPQEPLSRVAQAWASVILNDMARPGWEVSEWLAEGCGSADVAVLVIGELLRLGEGHVPALPEPTAEEIAEALTRALAAEGPGGERG